MAPAIAPGTTVVLRAADLSPPKMGDVVLLQQGWGLKLHRLFWGPPVAIGRTGWRTRGDRSLSWDPEISADVVLGTLVEVEGGFDQGVWARTWRLACLALVGFLKTVRATLKRQEVTW